MTNFKNLRPLYWTFVAMLLAPGGAIAAQANGQQTGRVTVALVDRLPEPGGLAVVVRRSSAPSTLILVTESTVSPAVIAGALGALAHSLARNPTTSGPEMRISISQAAFPPNSSAGKARLENLVERLRRAPSVAVNGFGQARTVTTGLPKTRTTAGAP